MFVGDCRFAANYLAQRQHIVRISTSGARPMETWISTDSSPLFQPRLDLLAALRQVALSHSLRVRDAQRLVIVPNALCVAGALFLGATALTVVVVTNLATLELYRRGLQARSIADGARGNHGLRKTLRIRKAPVRSPKTLEAVESMTHDPQPPVAHDTESLGPVDVVAAERALPPGEGGARKLEDLPKEFGVMLMSVGALGLVLPAMAGAPAIVAGGLVLWPRTFGKLERWLERRYPGAYHQGMRQIGRYLDDFERRFPDSTRR